MSKSLPEIGVVRNPNHYASWGSKDGKPHFPKECPICGSEIVFLNVVTASYDCGAEYTHKPQIQNHTEVYWGTCPKGEKKCSHISTTS